MIRCPKLLPQFANVTVKGQTQLTNIPITIRQMMMLYAEVK
jgi:hypothetical protein